MEFDKLNSKTLNKSNPYTAQQMGRPVRPILTILIYHYVLSHLNEDRF